MKIRNTLQFLYTEDAGGECPYDVDYTIFIFDDGTVAWDYGKEHQQDFQKGDTVETAWVASLESPQSLPCKYTLEELQSWEG